MFEDTFKKYAQQVYEGRTNLPGELRREIEWKLKICTPEEQVLMKFFYGTMPLGDAGTYEFEVFLGFVRHGLMLYETMDWCRNLPEEIFLHHVLYYRINSERIEDCRRFFYKRLIDRIEKKTLEEAVLEINYWCAENGSYEASDIRTVSPMTMYRSGKGRCGEESTFAVTALRSVGIPARQVYTPKWAHCDDNHAWVEVYVNGKWHFLGACEPEEVLDKGWFVNASSRAMMIHTREFSDYKASGDSMCITQEEGLYYHNITARYAKTGELQISVAEEDGTPAGKAKVLIEVLNSGEYGRIAALSTDEEGKASLHLGIGTVHLWAMKGTGIGEKTVYVKDREEVLLTLKKGRDREGSGVWTEIDIKAPKESVVYQVHITKQQKEKNHQRLQASAMLRTERIDGYYREELAEKYPEEEKILRLAAGNFCQIYGFLEKDRNPDRKRMLHSLSEKDYKDVKGNVLESHLREASGYRGEWEEKGELEIYIRYILCPRIYFEEITPFREKIQQFFSDREKEQFKKDPGLIQSYIEENIRYDEKDDYSTLFSTPSGTLKTKFGNPISRNILCVAICRTMGIPARLNPVTREAEIYKNDGFVRIFDTKECTKSPEKGILVLKRKDGEEWNYYQNWTIGQYRQDSFVTLNYEERKFEGKELRLELKPGFYRLLTTNRLPGGDQLASECKISLEAGQREEQELRMRSGYGEELLVSNELENFEVEDNGKIRPISVLTESCMHILVFLKPGEEPTEHVLNEMNLYAKNLRDMKVGICFLMETHAIQKTSAWERAVKAFPEAKIVFYASDDIAQSAARRMYVEPDKLPLLILVNPGLNGVYGCSGYNVGTVKLLLELLRVKFTDRKKK